MLPKTRAACFTAQDEHRDFVLPDDPVEDEKVQAELVKRYPDEFRTGFIISIDPRRERQCRQRLRGLSEFFKKIEGLRGEDEIPSFGPLNAPPSSDDSEADHNAAAEEEEPFAVDPLFIQMSSAAGEDDGEYRAEEEEEAEEEEDAKTREEAPSGEGGREGKKCEHRQRRRKRKGPKAPQTAPIFATLDAGTPLEAYYVPLDPYDADTHMTRGEIGCFQGHRRAWYEFLTSRKPYGYFLEDDANMQPTEGVITMLEKAVIGLRKAPWDLLFVGRNPEMCQMRPTERFGPSIVWAGTTWGMFAYLLTRRAARMLLAGSRYFHEPLDDFISTTAWIRRKIALSPIPFTVIQTVSQTVPPNVAAPLVEEELSQ